AGFDTFAYIFDYGDYHVFRITVLDVRPAAGPQSTPNRHSQHGLSENANIGSDNIIHVEHSLLLREANALSILLELRHAPSTSDRRSVGHCLVASEPGSSLPRCEPQRRFSFSQRERCHT